ncbi:MAG: PD-(D/E)XK nuclease family protein [Acidobacteria bacterium]|nr:PD-(D/E)XK nuclease family protein [Acidobacteriota bacterium]MBI3656807.1 PD-(D/E)XK nuclease family protein [Acidobacteriota bacterium]
MAVLRNEFSWSKSRSDKFNDCRRAYFYHYYGSWGGWDMAADVLARELYILKNLSGRQAWAGKVVHDTIAWVLSEYKVGTEIAFEAAVARAREVMITDYRNSNTKGYRQYPKSVGLFEHEYNINLARERWKDNYENVERCLKNFYNSAIFASIKSTPTERWLPIEQLNQFAFEGTPVWVVIDFAMRDEDGNILIVDWKTGKNRKAAEMIQLFCYGLFANQCWGADIGKVVCRLEYLAAPETSTARMDPAGENVVKTTLRKSIEDMRMLLRDPQLNMAMEDDFPKITNDRQCFWCNFRRVCKPHIA